MEDNFNQNDFEEFLQDHVRNHRMYPSDAVWREIDKKLHGEKTWPGLTVAALMLLSATVLVCVYFTPKPNIFATPANVNTSKQPAQKNNILNNLTAITPFNVGKGGSTAQPKNALPGLATTLPGISESLIESGPVTDKPEIVSVDRISVAQMVPANPSSIKLPAHPKHPRVDLIAAKEKATAAPIVKGSVDNSLNPALASNDKRIAVNQLTGAGELQSTIIDNNKNIANNVLNEHKSNVTDEARLRAARVKSKFSYQVYVAPSFSYRKLLEDNSVLKENNGGPVGLNFVTDVNKVVRHKPGTGIEVGVSFMYNLSNVVRVKTGIQFNMRQYSIEAYRSATELASISLLRNNRIDTVNTLAFYRNSNGYSSTELVNRYYQISMPIGIEWQVVGNRKIQLNVAGTIQPTYLLNRNAYLLSTNFKNYTESPGMIRQWNLNSNIEAFISVRSGEVKFQLGPQMRYQPYSTFIPQYPIKEHLLDYGVKFGVSRVINK